MRGFRPSCQAKRLEEWGEGVRRSLPLDVPHRRLAEIFAREVFRLVVDGGLLSPEWAERILSVPVALRMIEEESPPARSKGWAEMIRKVHEVDPMICPRCGGRTKVVAFLTEHAVAGRIIRHLGLTFVAEKPPPALVFERTALMAAEESGEYE